MRFAFVIYRYFPHGGLQRDFLRVLREAIRRGHHVTVLAAQMDAPLPALDRTSVKLLPVSGIGNHRKMKNFEIGVQAFLEKNPFDQVLMFNRMAGGDFYFAADNCLATWYARRRMGKLLRCLPRYRTFLALEKSVFDPARKTRILALVPGQIADYRKSYATPLERFVLLPPGIDRDFCPPSDAEMLRREVCREFHLPENALLLIQTAAKFHTKGVDRTLRAFASLAGNIAGRCRLLIVGGDDAQKEKKLCRALGIADKVVFTGARNDMPRLIGASRLMIHPARNEAAGAVIAEALATGVPVIVSQTCGFASFAAQVDEKLVLPEPFCQQQLDETLVWALTGLARLGNAAKTFGKTCDFYRRAEVIVNLLENR